MAEVRARKIRKEYSMRCQTSHSLAAQTEKGFREKEKRSCKMRDKIKKSMKKKHIWNTWG
jgi:hypothetical protein